MVRSPEYQQAVILTYKLHKYMSKSDQEGLEEDPKCDEIRDELDSLCKNFSEEEEKLIQSFSENLYFVEDFMTKNQTVKDSFRARLDKVEENVAYVTMGVDGEEMTGRIPYEELSRHGINLDKPHFTCYSIENYFGEIDVRYKMRDVEKERQENLERISEIMQGFSDEDLQDDY